MSFNMLPNRAGVMSDMAARAESAVLQGLRDVLLKVHRAAEASGRPASAVRLVAVSKTKPPSLIQEVYDAGHRHFGENYVQELIDKAQALPTDIRWHFVGHLQSNKAKALVCVPNLFMVEGVDSPKVANHLDRAIGGLGRSALKVLVQVNTSGEVSKSGVGPSESVELARYVRTQCPNLEFCGFMTIGMLDYTSTPENFKALRNCRDEASKAFEIPEHLCELSMGMSGDYEQAIQMGSTSVRVGSAIFGAREYSAK